MAKKSKYDHRSIEAKWQEAWAGEGIYTPDVNKAKNPFYNLWMFPYPSAEGLHAGHAYASTGSDIYGRFMRMQGKDVFQPIGYDSFGIHSENYALKVGENPETIVPKTSKNYERQLKSLGHGYDWTRTVTTSDIDYYVWTQWLFVQLFKAGLAYRKEAKVNWCPSCKTVLADEQVINGKCERCSTEVQKKDLAQWFFRITDYADKLLANLEKIDWPGHIKLSQKNWIGKSEGESIRFRLVGSSEYIEVFTTRPDTLYGATFLVLSPHSAWVGKVTTKENMGKVSEYVKNHQQSAINNQQSKLKTGVFTGGYTINPATGEEIPIWVSDYVLEGYGSGAIMGVPSHDERDKEFALTHKLEVRQIVPDEGLWDIVEQKDWGRRAVSFHLRDWLISRQRYWGPPIPAIYCPRCAKEGKSYFSEAKGQIHADQNDWEHTGWYPVDENELPVKLPHIEDYRPVGTGKGPLANHPEFYETVCPACGSKAMRETDVSDTFLDSSWYFLRYPSVGTESKLEDRSLMLDEDVRSGKVGNRVSNFKLQNPDSHIQLPTSSLPWDPEITRRWLPVDLYFGGAEHAVLHLMYSRFMTMVLHDIGKVDFEEPFPRFFAHGLMIKDSAKMSKSKGNVVNPDPYIEKFGADALRLYLMFIGPMDGSPVFRDTGMEGMKRFVNRLWELFTTKPAEKSNKEATIKMHQTINKVTEDIQNFRYNVAIAAIMEYVNVLKENGASAEALKNLALMLAPFAPHMTEEVWHMMGNTSSIHKASWPQFDPDLAREKRVVVVVQINGKLRAELEVNSLQGQNQEEIEKLSKSDPNIVKWLEGKKVKKAVFVPGRLINFVI
ncbi:leucine--tRNA ligase [Patescibacteria group bacterium]|nr:leucine--tRNA ligase [Patescibacteria group bacterium]